MKRCSKFFLIGVIASILLVMAALWLPIPSQPWSDFAMLYSATRGLGGGINLYDHVSQVSLMRGIMPDGLVIPFYVYPPWYALSVFYLGLLAPEQAARLWMLLNAVMLAVSVFLLTDGWSARKRVLSYAAAFLFPPVLGILVVGQFVMPVLLGTALFLSGVRQRSNWMIALGLLLLTFKPHVGFLMLLVGGLWLISRSGKLARPALGFATLGGLILVGVSFVFDPGWLQHYFGALRGFGNLDTFVVCELCAGVSSQLVRWFTGQPYTTVTVWVSLFFAFLGSIYLIRKRPGFEHELEWLVNFGAIAVLFVNPYLMNYDFVMLLAPAFYLSQHWQHRFSAAIPFLLFLPWLGLIFDNRQAVSALLVLCTVAIVVLMINIRAKKEEISV